MDWTWLVLPAFGGLVWLFVWVQVKKVRWYKRMIRESVAERRGQVERIRGVFRWSPFMERNTMHWEVTYRDGHGALRTSRCKTGLFGLRWLEGPMAGP